MTEQRGIAQLKIEGKDPIPLCMTLGVLAAIEEKYDIEDISKIGDIFNKPTASKVLFLVFEMHKGAGGKMTLEEIKNLPLDLGAMQDALKGAISAAFPQSGEGSSTAGK